MSTESDKLRDAIEHALQTGLDAIQENVGEELRTEITRISNDLGEALSIGRNDLAEELLTQIPVRGEVQRLITLQITRDQLQVMARAVVSFVIKAGIAAI